MKGNSARFERMVGPERAMVNAGQPEARFAWLEALAAAAWAKR